MSKKITENYIYNFDINESCLYVVEIEASCEAGRIFKRQGLRVQIDKRIFREVPETGKSQFFNIPVSWNGKKLKGKSKTVFFVLYLEKGEHSINFIPKEKAIIQKDPIVKKFNSGDSVVKKIQANKGNQYPWVTVALIDLPLKLLDVSVTCEKRKRDSDDVKLIIDGKIEKNKQSGWWGKNWYFQGRFLKGNTRESRFYTKLEKGIYYVEFWADEMPILNSVSIYMSAKDEKVEEEQPSQKTLSTKIYTYKGIRGNQDYNRYDKQIERWTKYWNDKFLNDKYPVEEALDPSLVKAIVYQESKMGYYSGGEIDLMQVGNEDDPALHIINNDETIRLPNGEVASEREIKNGKEWVLDYGGEAKIETIDDSLKWGIRWLYHKAQGITHDQKRYWRTWREAVFGYGPNTKEYTESVWTIYKNGLDKSKNGIIKLWLILFLILMGLSSYIYYNQGRVYFKDIDMGEKYIWIGRARLEIGILDGLQIKKAVIGPVKNKALGCRGIIRDSVVVDYYDLDNDGQDDVLVSARNSIDEEEMYFFRIGEKDLEPIGVRKDRDTRKVCDNNLFSEDIFFDGVDKQGKYKFITRDIVDYDNGDQRIFKSYYEFNKVGELAFQRKIIEESLAINN